MRLLPVMVLCDALLFCGTREDGKKSSRWSVRRIVTLDRSMGLNFCGTASLCLR